MTNIVTPLDLQSLRSIPSSIEGKFYLGGPYEFEGLLQEPDQYGDEEVELRSIHIAQPDVEQARHAYVAVACGEHFAQLCDSPLFPTKVEYELRYLYRDEAESEILGVVQVSVSHVIHGVRHRFVDQCRKVIKTVHVKPASRRRGIARILLAVVISDAPDALVHPQFSEDGARLFGFDRNGRRLPLRP